MPRLSSYLAALMIAAPAFALAADPKPGASATPTARLVPADAPFVMTFRPATVLKLADVKALYEEFTRKDEIKRVVDVAEPESIEEITLVVLKRDLKLGGGDPHEALARASAVIIRTNKPREWKALMAAAQMAPARASHQGREYYRVGVGSDETFGFFQPDDRTVVAATEPMLKAMMDAKPAAAAEAEEAEKPSAENVATMKLDVSLVREILAPAVAENREAALPLAVIGPIWEKTDALVVRINATDAEGLVLSADHNCKDDAGAAGVEKTVEAILTLARNAAPEAIKLLREQSKGDPDASEAADLAEAALKSASIERKGTRVRVKTGVKLDLAKIAKRFVLGE